MPDERLRLVRWLAEITAPRARVHVVVRGAEDAIACPLRFTLETGWLDIGHIRYEPAGTTRLPLSRLLPAEVAKVLAPLQVLRAFTLKNGFKLDLPTTLATAYFALRSDSHFDASASLSSGMPVFITHVQFADGHWRGSQIAGAIWVVGNPDDPSPDASQSSVLAHERVHVLQYDFTLVSWSGPAEDWLSNRYPSAAWALRHLDLGLQLGPWQAANWVLPYTARPWEHEAHFLSGSSSGHR